MRVRFHVVALEPTAAKGRLMLGDVCRAQGDQAGADAQCREAARLQPGNPLYAAEPAFAAALAAAAAAPRDSAGAAGHCRRAADALNQGRSEDAVREGEAALAGDPGLDDAYSVIGLALQNLGRHAEAETLGVRAEEGQALASMVYRVACSAAMRLGRMAAAARFHGEEYGLNPGQTGSGTLERLGETLPATGRKAEAREAWRAAAADPRGGDAAAAARRRLKDLGD